MIKDAIKLELFCEFHKVDKQMIYSFIDNDFFEVVKEEENIYIPNTSVEEVERCIRLSADLGINIAGVEVIQNMRRKMLRMQHELRALESLKKELIDSGRFDNEDDIIEIYISMDDN